MLAIALVAGLVGLFAKSLFDNATTVSALVADGKSPAAPAFTLRRLDGGGTASLAGWRGRIVVLNFWASWCGPCKDEAPLLEQVQQAYAGRGVTVVGVDSEDVDSRARGFARTYHLTYPLLVGTQELQRRWGVGGFPETFVIDRRGDVVRHFKAPVTGDVLRPVLQSLLGARA